MFRYDYSKIDLNIWKKILLLIVPGSKTKSLPIIQPILDEFYTYYWVDLENDDDWTTELKSKLNDDIKTEIFNWEWWISEKSAENASKELSDFIKSNWDYDNIILFWKSLWGFVSEKLLNDKELWSKISKIIYVATPHKTKNIIFPKGLKVINIYSKYDRYQKLATNTLYLWFWSQTINWVENINIEWLNHSDFNKNTEIEYNWEKYKLFDFYKEIILNN